MQKLYCYVDETGQDTQGAFFLIALVILRTISRASSRPLPKASPAGSRPTRLRSSSTGWGNRSAIGSEPAYGGRDPHREDPVPAGRARWVHPAGRRDRRLRPRCSGRKSLRPALLSPGPANRMAGAALREAGKREDPRNPCGSEGGWSIPPVAGTNPLQGSIRPRFRMGRIPAPERVVRGTDGMPPPIWRGARKGFTSAIGLGSLK